MEFAKKEANQQLCDSKPEFKEHSASGEAKIIRCSCQLSEEKFSYTWKIFNFDSIPFINGYPIFSHTFHINRKNSSRWQIVMTKHTCLYKAGHDEGDYISGSEDSFTINRLDCSDKEKVEDSKSKRIGFRLAKFENTCNVWDTVRYSFTVKTSSGAEVSTEEREEPGLASYENLLEGPRYAFLTEDDFPGLKLFDEKCLEVTCNINYSYMESGTIDTPVAYEGKRFVENLRVLYVNNKYSDVSLNVKGEQFDNAHKIILHAAIPSLEKLLKDSDKPKEKLDLKLDSEVGEAMVSFIYSGEIVTGFPVEKCLELHKAGKRYGIDCLGPYCSDYFKANLAVDTCRECLGITEGLDDCLESVKKLSVQKVKRILKNEACSHKKRNE